MAEKFLYYLGAGASAQALPTVNRIMEGGTVLKEGLLLTMRQFAEGIRKKSNFTSNEQRDFLYDLAEKIEIHTREAFDFATIDTYAKFLFLKDEKSYGELITSLSSFFVLYQIWYNKFDKRYLSWLTSVMSTTMFPANIKILTWNYDFQMELAGEYFQNEKLNKGGLHSPPLIGYWPAVGWSGQPHHTEKDISIVHLNGLAGSCYNTEIGRYDNLFLHKEELHEDSNFYLLRQYGHSRIFDFAWQDEGHKRWAINLAKNVAAETTIMIVIGYSFPFFNRDVDKKIFEKIKDCGKLKKIYFQDPVLDGSFLKAQFDLDDNVEIIHRKEVDSFYIPFEL
jgi:hypothetical protein